MLLGRDRLPVCRRQSSDSKGYQAHPGVLHNLLLCRERPLPGRLSPRRGAGLVEQDASRAVPRLQPRSALGEVSNSIKGLIWARGDVSHTLFGGGSLAALRAVCPKRMILIRTIVNSSMRHAAKPMCRKGVGPSSPAGRLDDDAVERARERIANCAESFNAALVGCRRATITGCLSRRLQPSRRRSPRSSASSRSSSVFFCTSPSCSASWPTPRPWRSCLARRRCPPTCPL
jgi:hypothetical protein